jgi:hypothetical protein
MRKLTVCSVVAALAVCTAYAAERQRMYEPRVLSERKTFQPTRVARIDQNHNIIGEWKQLTPNVTDGPASCALQWTYDGYDGDANTPDLDPVGGLTCGLPGPTSRWLLVYSSTQPPPFAGKIADISEAYDDIDGVPATLLGAKCERAGVAFIWMGDGVDDDPGTDGIQRNLAIVVETYEDWGADTCVLPSAFLGGLVFQADAVTTVDDDPTTPGGFYYGTDLDACDSGDPDLVWTMPSSNPGAYRYLFATYATADPGTLLPVKAQPMLWGPCPNGGSPCSATTRGPGANDFVGLSEEVTITSVSDCSFTLPPDDILTPECECFGNDFGICPDPLAPMIGFLTSGGGCPVPCVGDINGNCKTGQQDLGLLLASYNKCLGDALFNPAADLVPGSLPGTCPGGTSVPGVDQADLGVLLSGYGCGGSE